MLSANWWKTIDERLRRGDPTATAELAENVFHLLCGHLTHEFPEVRDQDCVDDAASEALISYVKRPEQYDPDQRGLRGYLEMSAEADLRNILAKERRRKRRERRNSAVELGHVAGKESSDEGNSNDSQPGQVVDTLAALFDDPLDRHLAALVVDGERSTEKFAAILSIMHLPASEQRKIVKRHKDRIKKVLHRRGRNHYG